MSSCRRCGACCRAIALPYTKAQLRRQLAGGALDADDRLSALFIVQHWRRLSRVAVQATPPGLQPDPGYRYYACDCLAGSLCADHVSRPPICRGFPYYSAPEGTNVDDLLISADCGYYSGEEDP